MRGAGPWLLAYPEDRRPCPHRTGLRHSSALPASVGSCAVFELLISIRLFCHLIPSGVQIWEYDMTYQQAHQLLVSVVGGYENNSVRLFNFHKNDYLIAVCTSSVGTRFIQTRL